MTWSRVLTSPDAVVAIQTEAHRSPQDREEPRKSPNDDFVVLHPAGSLSLASQDEERANGDVEDPIVGLNDEYLSHEAIELTKVGLFWIIDKSAAKIHRC